ncbi:MAG: GNAT family N-acetyltransferase [Cumulibacter sp.]
MIGAANVDLVIIEEDALDVRARSEPDAYEVAGWVEDAQALYLFSGPRLTWPLTAEHLQDMLSTEGLTAWVVVSRAGDLLAHFDLTIEGALARLGRVIVRPELRGRGLASRIVDLAVMQAQRLGAEVVRLNVIITNEPAIRAYRRASFDVLPGASSRADVIVMERQVTAALP